MSELDKLLKEDLGEENGPDVIAEAMKPRILIIDDDENVRESLLFNLRDDFNIRTCSSGEEGVEAVDTNVSAVILDIKMPGQDGFQTYMQIKQKSSHLPIIFHSAFQDLKDPYQVMNEYMPFGYVTKSSSIGKLRNSINNAVKYYTQIVKNRQLKNFLNNILNSMPSILVVVDVYGQVTLWNKEAEKITGATADQVQGCQLVEVLPQLAGEMENVRQVICDSQPRKDKLIQKNGDKTSVMNIMIYPLLKNGVEGAVIHVDDITERVRFEEMMIQSEKMLSLGGLAAGMAHEINNPLSGILQNTQVMENRLKNDSPINKETAKECGTNIEGIKAYMSQRKIFRMIDSIMKSGIRAAEIVNNMLSFSRESASKFTSQNLWELMDKAIELALHDYDLKKKYDFRMIKIVRNYDTSMPQVHCEASMIQQVFLNILRNGAQAMAMNEDDELTEKNNIFTLRVMSEGNLARIEIIDNGPGMDEATCKRIFDPFFTTKEVNSGTGLGLSVSYYIITENHNGTITAESTPGKGTKFIICLPIKKELGT